MAGTLFSAQGVRGGPPGSPFFVTCSAYGFLVIGTIEREIKRSPPSQLNAYLLGAAHDGTYNRLHRTIRISQLGAEWPHLLRLTFARLGKKSWIYPEGKRRVWVVESSMPPPLTRFLDAADDRAAYARGYFDAEGGIPRAPSGRFYIQFVQKDRADLEEVRSYLVSLRVDCGRIHNPSRAVDPEYWRFYVRCRSWMRFATQVGSWHPRKRAILDRRLPAAIDDRRRTG